MSLKTLHRILDLIDTHFDIDTEIDFFSDPTLEKYHTTQRRIFLVLEVLLKEEMILGLCLEGDYNNYKIIQESPRLTFKGMDWLYKINI